MLKVVLVGRPNVGKSTLFNRLVYSQKAIVNDQPGVTRDRNFAAADWAGRHFFIVDTGGVIEGSDEPLERAVRDQALAAVTESDVILFLVDGQQGIHPLDERLADVLRKSQKPVLLIANKIDNLPNDQRHQEFWSLGMGEPIPVSALSGKGSGDLLDQVVDELPRVREDLPCGLPIVALLRSSFLQRRLHPEHLAQHLQREPHSTGRVTDGL